MHRAVRPTERLILQMLEPAMGLLRSEKVTEVLLNGSDAVFVEEAGKLHDAPPFLTDQASLEILVRLLAQHAGRVLRSDDFELDAAIDGPPALRIHAEFGQVCPQGICLSIRKLGRSQLTPRELIEDLQTLPQVAWAYLSKAVQTGRNILISGGTGAGKTSLLNVLASVVPSNERIIVIEDTREIDLGQPDVVYLVSRRPDLHGEGEVTMRDLFRSALRMRPDRVIIGEVRGPEAFDLVQALSAGHAGSLTTVHADTPTLALRRLHALALMSGVPVPPGTLQKQISEVISVVVQLARRPGGARKVVRVEDVRPSGGESWELEPVFAISDLEESA